VQIPCGRLAAVALIDARSGVAALAIHTDASRRGFAQPFVLCLLVIDKFFISGHNHLL
jgi:hypothetical protein